MIRPFVLFLQVIVVRNDLKMELCCSMQVKHLFFTNLFSAKFINILKIISGQNFQLYFLGKLQIRSHLYL